MAGPTAGVWVPESGVRRWHATWLVAALGRGLPSDRRLRRRAASLKASSNLSPNPPSNPYPFTPCVFHLYAFLEKISSKRCCRKKKGMRRCCWGFACVAAVCFADGAQGEVVEERAPQNWFNLFVGIILAIAADRYKVLSWPSLNPPHW